MTTPLLTDERQLAALITRWLAQTVKSLTVFMATHTHCHETAISVYPVIERCATKIEHITQYDCHQLDETTRLACLADDALWLSKIIELDFVKRAFQWSTLPQPTGAELQQVIAMLPKTPTIADVLASSENHVTEASTI